MSTLPFTCSKPSDESRCFEVFVSESLPYDLRLTPNGFMNVVRFKFQSEINMVRLTPHALFTRRSGFAQEGA